MNYLSAIMAIRFLGLFIVMPLLAVYALKLNGATDTTVGIALGAYALSQMFLQVVFGKLSDKYGRKHILAFGLFILALGSIVCAMSDNIYTLIFGRILQGAGAIGGVVLAYLNDLATEETRGKIFARMGQFIALAFGISMIAGPTLGAKYGVGFLFDITALLAILAIIILYLKVPNPPKVEHFEEKVKISEIFRNKELLKVYFSGFMQKGMMTIIFFLTPLIFVNECYGIEVLKNPLYRKHEKIPLPYFSEFYRYVEDNNYILGNNCIGWLTYGESISKDITRFHNNLSFTGVVFELEDAYINWREGLKNFNFTDEEIEIIVNLIYEELDIRELSKATKIPEDRLRDILDRLEKKGIVKYLYITDTYYIDNLKDALKKIAEELDLEYKIKREGRERLLRML